MARRAHAVDKNQAAIIRELRRFGSVVIDISAAGDGAPDIIASTWDGHWMPIEIKSLGGKLTPAEFELHLDCDVHGVPIGIAYCPEDALRLCGWIR
jgi:hypothetical protein